MQLQANAASPGAARSAALCHDFYIDREQYRRWNEPHLVIDVAEEPADTFSLEGLEGVHFIVAPRDVPCGCSERPTER
jgi:uncharacterized protein (DUF779 family)